MIGSTLAHYRVLAKLGEGGMGEVYRATDTKLKRDVAIKVLPPAFTADKERLARFEREAQLLAQLHHPNIASIFGLEESDGTRALVMELVEGPTLAERLEQGPLPFDESLSVSLQIAYALEEAHEKGIVHRDLKPQNIKASIDGRVKVLDFGLAKAMDPAGAASGSGASASELAKSPTLTLGATQMGVILGTAAYMSPEQAKGMGVDKRADVWAFGVVLWEMLVGRRLFPGDSVPETLAGVLKTEVEFDALPPEIPPAVRRLLRRCLERDPRERLRDIGEARIALREALEPGAAAAARTLEVKPAATSALARLRPWLVAALLAGALVWSLALGGAAARSAPGVARAPVLALRLPAGLSIPLDDRGIYGQTAVLAIAPDGAQVAFLEGAGSGPIHLRGIESDELRPLEGTAGSSSPFFSPDGRWVGFFSPGKLRKIAVDGGRPIDLADATLDRGAVWCPDGSIVFAPSPTGGLFRLPAGGGAPVALTEVGAGERTHRWPAVLPGGAEVAFTVGVVGQPGDYEESRIDVVELASGRRRPLLTGASMVRFTANGIVLLARQGQVLATPLAGLSPATVESAKQVLKNVAGVPASGIVHFDVAADGTLVYAERDPHADELDLVWFGADGKSEPLGVPKAEYSLLRIAPNGRRVAMSIGPGGGRGGDIWILDLATKASSKLTFDGRSAAPVWTSGGDEVIFQAALPSGTEEFRQRPADGSREARTIVRFADARARAPIGYMADGSLLFWEDGGTGSAGNLLFLPPGTNGDQAQPFASTAAIEIQPAISPDGRFVAYSLDTTGQPEVYVQPFPPTGAKWQVASDASMPLWSRDGRELYFARDEILWAVPVTLSGSFSMGAPREVARIPLNMVLTFDTSTSVDVALDGRFLAVRASSTAKTNEHLVVVLNWFEKLRRSGLGGVS
jgi:hypothetical protein